MFCGIMVQRICIELDLKEWFVDGHFVWCYFIICLQIFCKAAVVFVLFV